MKYNRKYLDKDNYYSIGIDEDTGEYLLEVIVTSVAWYSRYFKLTKDEIEAFKKDNQALLKLSKKLTRPTERLLEERLVHSDKKEEIENKTIERNLKNLSGFTNPSS